MPVSALPATKVTKSPQKVDLTQVWAERFDEIELAVCALPQHEVTEALLTRCSNDEVWIRLSLGIEALGDGLDGDALGEVSEGPANVLVFLHKPSHCLSDFGAPSIAHSQVDMKT
ncbi:unannotated protein [freshwater metagenome]|uniref:Unannotated protein n=1 Tax=freshwater metagenome TaxID=449393 RepID=A0A6J6F1E9_9ZZZZ